MFFPEQKSAVDSWGLTPGGFIQERPQSWNSGVGKFEPENQVKPYHTMEIRYDRDGRGDSGIMPMWADAKNKVQKWQAASAASQDYSQYGTDIPNFSEGSGGAFAEGSDFPGRGFGYQYQTPMTAQGIPVGQDSGLPMSQEEFSDFVRTRIGRRENKPVVYPAELLQKINRMRSSLNI